MKVLIFHKRSGRLVTSGVPVISPWIGDDYEYLMPDGKWYHGSNFRIEASE